MMRSTQKMPCMYMNIRKILLRRETGRSDVVKIGGRKAECGIRVALLPAGRQGLNRWPEYCVEIVS